MREFAQVSLSLSSTIVMRIEDSCLQEIAAASNSRLDLWTRWLQVAKARVILEVGVWKGDFAKEVLQQCEFIDQYYMIDPWANLPDWNKPLNVKREMFDRA